MLILDLSLIMPFAFDSFDIWCGRTSTCSLDYAGFVLTRNKVAFGQKSTRRLMDMANIPSKTPHFPFLSLYILQPPAPKASCPFLSLYVLTIPVPQPTINLATVCLVCAKIQSSPAVLHRWASGTLCLEFRLS